MYIQLKDFNLLQLEMLDIWYQQIVEKKLIGWSNILFLIKNFQIDSNPFLSNDI